MTTPETTQPHELSATRAAALIREGVLTSERLVRSCLERIEAREEVVGAWAYLDREAAIREARRRDTESPRGPLHGVPVGVKDIIATACLPTEYGSPIYAGHRTTHDATCVTRLQAAGALVLGKTVTTEFALFHPGRTANPRDPSRTPGGSSSGSAAAVADTMVPVALGTQTAGSIVRPASFCGVFGFKPTFGLVDRSGVNAVSPSLDTLGPLARAVPDLALAAAVMAGRRPEEFDPDGVGFETPSIGFVRTPEWAAADPDTRDRIEAAVETIARHTRVREVSPPEGFARLADSQRTIMEYEAAVQLDGERRNHRGQLSEILAETLDRGRRIGERTYREALNHAAACRQALPRLFSRCDVVLAPSAIGQPPSGLQATGDPLFCRAWTMLGTPAVAVPGLTGADGLPLGVQVIAPPHRDAVALAGARWLADHL
ncbi:MAG: amidase [Streptomycetales bacterium]